MATIPYRDALGNVRYLKSDNAGDSGDPDAPYRKLSDAIVDDAAFTVATSKVMPVGGTYQAAADLLDDGDAGALRVSRRRAAITLDDYHVLTLTQAAPTPSGTDITTVTGGNITSSMLQIRDTSSKIMAIPMGIKGYSRLMLGFLSSPVFDQALTISAHPAVAINTRVSTLLSFSVPIGIARFGVGNGAVGQGGIAGGASAVDFAWYNVPGLSTRFPYLLLYITASSTPTAGSVELTIVRS